MMLGIFGAWWTVRPSWLGTLAFGLALASVPITGAPPRRENSSSQLQLRIRRGPIFLDQSAQDFLMNFGYIPASDRETGNLRSEDQLIDAIKTLQEFGHIPVTGNLDGETIRLMQKPRCGLPDVSPKARRKKRYTLHGQKWHYTNLTWSLRSEYIHNLDHGQVRSELHRALQVWSKHSKLSFTEVNSDRADILIYFERGYHGDGYEFDGRGKILAHAFFPGSGRGGDAHFDEEENWILDPFSDPENVEGTSLFAVAAHEFGHSLGLSHSSVQGALMYPWYQGLAPDFQLPDDDRFAIQQLYGAKEDKLWGRLPAYDPNRYRPTHRPPPPPRPTPTTTTTTTSTTTMRPHVRHRPAHSPKRPIHPHHHQPPPDTCNTDYDAVSVIRGELFIFKDKYLWRIDDKGLQKDYPTLIHRLWHELPANLSRIDAAYERNDKKIVFFSGKQVFVFDANVLLPGYPKPLTSLGLPQELQQVDAAMVWGHNSKTYFFSGTMYWRFDEDESHVELDYPRDMSMWKDVGYNIDAVFQWKDGKTYFFKGKKFWKFNDLRMRAENPVPQLSAPFWMGCPRLVQHEVPSNKWPLISPNDLPKTSDASLPRSPISVIFTLIYVYALNKYLFLYF